MSGLSRPRSQSVTGLREQAARVPAACGVGVVADAGHDQIAEPECVWVTARFPGRLACDLQRLLGHGPVGELDVDSIGRTAGQPGGLFTGGREPDGDVW
jgi:hypothetical protein